MTNLTLISTCYKSIIAWQEHEYEEMGAGWSQDDASQSQPNKESSQTVPQNKAEAVEISVEAKPRPRETIAEVATPQVKLPLNSQAIILKEESTINSLVRTQTCPHFQYI
jgi:hypothetical protein